MSKVVHFEIPADDPERAVKFYQDVFAWKMNKWEGGPEYWVIEAGPKEEMGIDGGLMKRMHPGHAVTYYINVESVDEAVADIQAHGGEVLTPKMPVPGMGWLAHFKDTEGNALGVFQVDMSAK